MKKVNNKSFECASEEKAVLKLLTEPIERDELIAK
jgi:hypothetical protein